MKDMSSKGSNMHAGMSRKSPSGTDKSMSTPKGNTVNEGTRSAVAPQPGQLGGRVA